MKNVEDCEHNHPLMSPNSAVAVCPDCGGHMWHDDEDWRGATGGASVLASEVQRLRAALDEARRDMCDRYCGDCEDCTPEPTDTPKGGA